MNPPTVVTEREFRAQTDSRLASGPDDTEPVVIVALFADDAARSRIQHLIFRLADHFPCETWTVSFDELRSPGACGSLDERAAAAAVLVVAGDGDEALPPHLHDWLARVVGDPAAERDRAMVALMGPETESHGHRLMVDLQSIAVVGGLAFFTNAPSDEDEPMNSTVSHIHQRADAITPVMAAILEHGDATAADRGR
jgi:hypothetical protein